MEVDNCGTKSQHITKQDIQRLAKVTYCWSDTNFHVIELDELHDVPYYDGERSTLIINIHNKWNTLVLDEHGKLYFGYTDAAVRDALEPQFTANGFKKRQAIKINNNGLSALINATVINNLLDNSQTVTANFVKKFDTTQLRFALNQCLVMIRGINIKFKCSHNYLKMVKNPPADMKAGALTSSPPVEAAKQANKRTFSDPQESPVTPQKISKPSPVGDRACFTLSPRVVIRNKEPMSYPQMEVVHDRIINAISLLGEDVPGPQFLDRKFESGGSVIITCKNQESMEWLLESVPTMCPWAGAELAIKSESELLAGAVFKTYIPEKVSVELALCLIAKQNPELNSKQWWVLKETKVRNGFHLTVAVSETCAQALRNIKHSVALGVTSDKFHSVNAQIKSKHQKFSSPAADKMGDLQAESEVPNKTASPKAGQKSSKKLQFPKRYSVPYAFRTPRELPKCTHSRASDQQLKECLEFLNTFLTTCSSR